MVKFCCQQCLRSDARFAFDLLPAVRLRASSRLFHVSEFFERRGCCRNPLRDTMNADYGRFEKIFYDDVVAMCYGTLS